MRLQGIVYRHGMVEELLLGLVGVESPLSAMLASEMRPVALRSNGRPKELCRRRSSSLSTSFLLLSVVDTKLTTHGDNGCCG